MQLADLIAGGYFILLIFVYSSAILYSLSSSIKFFCISPAANLTIIDVVPLFQIVIITLQVITAEEIT